MQAIPIPEMLSSTSTPRRENPGPLSTGAFANANNIDASHAVFNDVGRDQYNLVFNGQDGLEELKPVRMDASRRSECLPNTRTHVRKFIQNWIDDPSSQQKMLWLYGLAGSGKSTLATTIASDYRSSGQLGAFLFFDRQVNERSDPAVVIRTLAHQLGAFDPRLRTAICSAIQNNPNICLSPIAHQFQKLILLPLSTVEIAPSLMIVVIDALDECGAPNKRDALLHLLAEQTSNLPSAVRIIVTSRAEWDISGAFKSRHHILSHELDITSQANSDDILVYFQDRMANLRTYKADLCLGADWPGEVVLGQLVQQASGLFVWAFTASEFIISGYDPKKRLDVVLGEEIAPGAETALDSLYTTALESADLWDDIDFVADFRAIVGVVLVARQPLSNTSIDALLCSPERRPCRYTISLIGCVLQPSPAVRILHSSFADFLVSKERCRRDVWLFDRSTCHRSLASQCLNRLDAVLKRNMCNMTTSAALADESLPEDVSYACLFWVDHISAIEEDVMSIAEHLYDFLCGHLMHWFEAMSILRRSRDTISLLDRLLRWTLIHVTNQPKLSELIRDASHFARVFSSLIEEHPLLIYVAALPFTPTGTHLYRAFHDPRLYPSVAGGFQKSWSPALLVLNGHEKEVLSVAFSRDGTRIVSGSNDHTIRVWDAASGAEIPPTMRGHRNKVRSVCFSPDGTRIASGSYDMMVRIWDATSGAQVFPPLRGHRRAVMSVAFSPDGSRVASGSEDKTIRVWDATSGIQVLPELRGHKHTVMSIAFFPDGTRIVSGSNDNTIRIWDVTSGSVICSLRRGHDDWVLSVSPSPDGLRIASGSEDKTLRVWDATTGAQLLPPLRGHHSRVQSVTFSPEGNRLASCSDDKTIRLWDAHTGVQVRPALQGHNSWIQSIAFSSDGTRLASGSGDKTIRVWDATSDAEVPVQWGHDYSVSSMAFSLDGTRVVSGSFDQTIRVWDTTTGAQVLPPLRGHNGAIFSVAFSPDGNHIVSSSDDKTVRVWSITSGEQALPELRRHDDRVSSVAFSSDGTRIVSGSKEGNTQIWDAKSGATIFTAPDGRHMLRRSTSFSSDEVNPATDRSDRLIKDGDAVSNRQRSGSWTDDSSHLHSSTISIVDDGWIIDSTTGERIGKLPPIFKTKRIATSGRSLAVGTSTGQILVVHLPVVP